MSSEPTERLTDSDRGYFASLVDQKGCIYVAKRGRKSEKPKLELRLQFYGLPESTAKWIEARFKVRTRLTRDTGYQCTFVSERAAAALARVFSQLTSPQKRAQAVLAFKFNAIKRTRYKWAPEEHDIRMRIRARMQKADEPMERRVAAEGPVFEVVRLAGGK